MMTIGLPIAPALDGSNAQDALMYYAVASQVYNAPVYATFAGTPWTDNTPEGWNFTSPVALGCNDAEIVVAICGTRGPADIVTDLNGINWFGISGYWQALELDSSKFPGQGMVHPGFLGRTNQCRAQVLAEIQTRAAGLK